MSTTAQPGSVPTYEGRPLDNPAEPVFDQGLRFDLETVVARRQLLKLIGYGASGAGLMALAACMPGSSVSGSATGAATISASSSAATGTADCTVIPEETAGPFPGDGSNGPDVLTQSRVVRADIRSSFGSASGTAQGIPLTIKLAIMDLAKDCAPLAGAAVYAWHCTREGGYSLYSAGVENENFLRGVQAAGSDGIVTFQSVFPGCYAGRWPHIHFEVYPSLGTATDQGNKIATSQIALPKDACDQVYATDGYAASIQNLAGVSLQRDNVFGEDGGIHQLGSMSGSLDNGLSVALNVPVNA